MLVTDCYESPEELGRCADALRMRGQDLIVFHLVDAGGARLPVHGRRDVRGCGVRRRCSPLRPDDLRKQYLELLDGAPRGASRSGSIASGADYVRVDTDQPLDRALHAYLDRRLRAEPGALMGFLVPAFLAGLAAIAVPIVLHLRHRDKDQPHRFPSLMFLERLPIRTAQRRRITDWPLLLLRALAIALLVLAFARPLCSRPSVLGCTARSSAPSSCCSTAR